MQIDVIGSDDTPGKDVPSDIPPVEVFRYSDNFDGVTFGGVNFEFRNCPMDWAGCP